MPFDLANSPSVRTLDQWQIIISFGAAATIVCERVFESFARTGSGSFAWGFKDSAVFQSVAEIICRLMQEEESKGFQEPPDIHMHPEPMPWDYNDWRDHKGREVARHNYH